jgi:predicted esterase
MKFHTLKPTVLSILMAWAFAMPHSIGQKLPTGPQVLTFFSDLDDSEQPYGLYLPQKYNPKNRYPLVVMLHGAGSNHRLALRRVFGKSNAEGENDVEATRYFPEWKDVEYIVVTPYARGTAGYQGFREKDVLDVVADVKRRFRIDDDRCYLTGLSMGGGGTLWLGLSYPDMWAAIAPVCPAPPAGTDSLAMNALHIPVHFFHGEKDPVVPADISRNWVKNLQALGTPVVAYKEFPGVQHDSWVGAYADGFVFEWFKQFRRNPRPHHIRHTSRDLRHGKAYWASMTAIEPGRWASFDANWDHAAHVITIQTKALQGLRLELGNRKYHTGKPVTLRIDQETIELGNYPNIVELEKTNGKWAKIKVPNAPPLLRKKPGLEGPISDAFAQRHIYVYGTADNPAPAVLRARMDSVEKAANWSMYRGEFLGRVMFIPRIVADRDIRPSDSTAHLILFGTKETNSIIAQYANRLPMHLDPAQEKTHGLIYTYPIDGRYCTIVSGLPWWTGPAPSFRFLPPNQLLLLGFKDYLLFEGHYDKPVKAGYFGNDWK